MSLSDRFEAQRLAAAESAAPTVPIGTGMRPGAHAAPTPTIAAVPSPPAGTAPTTTLRQPAPARVPADAIADVKSRVMNELLARLGTRLNDTTLTEAQLHGMVREELARIVDAQNLMLSSEERQHILQEVADDALGLGPLQRLLDDRTITEIMVNGHSTIYVERAGVISRTPFRFTDEEHLRRVIDRIVSRVGRRVDESSPLVDARLPDGSRVNAVVPPLAVKGSSLTIRKFSETPYTVENLIEFGSLTRPLADFLRSCVEARLNVLVSGGTGTGKTTLLNVLSSFIPATERIVTIEDAVELRLQQEHVITLESRPPNIEGTGQITIRDLVRNSLRMRPDRIVVGECRGGEALDMLQAMNTGHDGSLSTIHSNSPRDCIARLETLVLMAGMDLPLRAIREQVASAIDVIVQIQRLADGSRRLTHVTEVIGMEGDTVVLQDAFVIDHAAGHARATGLRPRFLETFDKAGVSYDMALFDPSV